MASTSELIVVGATAPEVIKLVAAIDRASPQRLVIRGFLDDDPAKQGTTFMGIPVLGPVDLIATEYRDALFVNNVNRDMETRLRVHNRMTALGAARFATLVHPSVDTGMAELGDGVLINENAVIGPGCRIGRQTSINYQCIVGHEAEVGEFCFLAARSTVGARSVVGDGVLLGLHAVVLPSRRVGEWSVVGAGAVAVRHVEPRSTVFGNPAKKVMDR